MRNTVIYLLLICIIAFSYSDAQKTKKTKSAKQSTAAIKDTVSTAAKPMMTFVELGSVNCIPCKAMQKVMKTIEEKYGDQIKIIFYDVWKQEQAHYALEYKIRLIPTQLFLDKNGKELMRHEGYFPEKEIDAFLQSKGLKPNSNGQG